MSFGIYEGVEHVTDKPDCSVYTLFKDPVNYVADGGAESIEQLYARTGSFINETLKPALAENKKYPDRWTWCYEQQYYMPA